MASSLVSKYVPLSNEEIMSKAPSIMATEPWHGVNKRYNFIPTSELISEMYKHDFLPFAVHESNSRDADKFGYTKHAISFRHLSTFDEFENEVVPQVVIMNSHDKSSSYKIFCGIFRFVCSNGLIVGDKVSQYKIRHYGVNNTLECIIEASFRILEHSKNVMEIKSAWQALNLSYDYRLALAEKAHQIRFDGKDVPITPDMLLTPRNSTDFKNTSLWNTFNIIQENMMKGGQIGYYKDDTHKYKKFTTRPIVNVGKNLGMNIELWNAAKEVYEELAA